MFNLWAAMGIVAPILTAMFVFWMDIRSKVTAIETKMEPIWEWWNSDRGNGHARRKSDVR